MARNVEMEELQSRAAEVSGLLKMMSHPTRLLIACALRDGEASVSALEKQIGAQQPHLSRDLGRMRDEGLLEARRESRSVYYRIADIRLAMVIDALCEAFRADTPARKSGKPKVERRR